MRALRKVQKTVQALRDVRFDAGGLVTVVVQDGQTGEVLMVAHMNREALERTLTTGRMTYWSRSRQKFWVKGETSGNVQHLKEMRVDCDQDCLLALVDQSGPACHEGYRSCFYRRLEAEAREPITVAEQLKRPSDMYGAT